MRAASLVLALGAALLAACGSPPPVATAADAARANVQLADLQQGRSLLLAKCSSCHRVPAPAERRAAQWPHEVAAMAERAKLDDNQHHLIAQYLVTMAIP